MAVRVISSSLGHDGNMSRVKIAHGLGMICLNTSSSVPAACDRLAQGISLSTPILMATFAVVGNVLALIVLYSSRREAHARRTVFFVMLAGLAWTDLIGQFAVSPIAIVTYANNLRWLGGAALCRYHGFMMVSFGLVTHLIVCCMSVERLLAIKFSYYYAKHVTRRRAQVTFLASWCVTAMFTALPFLGFGSYELQYPGSWCFLNFHRESRVDTVYAAMFSSFNIVAITIMMLCNLIVAGTLYRLRRTRQRHRSPSSERRVTALGNGSSTPGTFIRARRHSDMEAQMIWFLCLITVAFSVCWLPLNVHILWMQFTGTTNRVLDLKFIRMASCNQILDPWLYVIFRKNSLLRIVGRLKACLKAVQQVPKEDETKAANMRYPVTGKSYAYQETFMDKSVLGGHCCLPAATFTRQRVQQDCEGKWNNDSESVAQSMFGCPHCNDQCKNSSVSNQIADESPWLPPYVSDTERFCKSISENSSTPGTGHVSGDDTSEHPCFHFTTHGMSEPLMDAASLKPKKTQNKLIKFLDRSVSSDSYDVYYSLDSKHRPSGIPTKHFKSKKTPLADSKQKSPFLGSSKNSATSRYLSYYHANQPQPAKFANSNSLLRLLSPPSTPASGTDDSVADSRNGPQTSTPANILLFLENIPESPAMERKQQEVDSSRKQNNSNSNRICDRVSTIALLATNDVKVSVSLNVFDSHFLDSSHDIHFPSSESSSACDRTKRPNRRARSKTRAHRGLIPADVSEEDVPLRRLYLTPKCRSSFSCKLLSAGMDSQTSRSGVSAGMDSQTSRSGVSAGMDSQTSRSGVSAGMNSQTSRSGVSAVGSRLDSSSSLHHSVDHSDHIKCFKSKKTLQFLSKSGQMAYMEGLKGQVAHMEGQASSCEHAIIELSVGSYP